MATFVQRLNDGLTRMQLSADVRRQIYTLIAFMLDNGNKMESSLQELYGIFSRDGKKAGAAPAVFLYEALTRTKEGRSFSDAVARYVSPEEASMIAAGERSGRLREAFGYAIDNLQRRKEVRAAVFKGAAYPLVLMGLLVALLIVVSFKLMPTLARSIDLTMLSGPAAWLNTIANIVSQQGLYVGVALFLAGAVVAWSLPNVTGNLRYHLDKLPPWSVYRAMQGTTFLLNVGVMLRSGIPMLSILELLKKTSSPYMGERIDACIQGTNAGLNLGEALHRSELDFPDAMAVRLIRVFASRDGFDTALDNFAREWSDSTVQRVKVAMAGFFYFALIAVALLLILIVLSMGDIKAVMESSYG